MISIYNNFSWSYIYPGMDPIILQYIYMLSLLQRAFRKRNIYFIAKAQESTGVSG